MNTSRSVVSRLLSAAQFISGSVPEPEPEEGFRVDRKETWENLDQNSRKGRGVFGTGQSVNKVPQRLNLVVVKR